MTAKPNPEKHRAVVATAPTKAALRKEKEKAPIFLMGSGFWLKLEKDSNFSGFDVEMQEGFEEEALMGIGFCGFWVILEKDSNFGGFGVEMQEGFEDEALLGKGFCGFWIILEKDSNFGGFGVELKEGVEDEDLMIGMQGEANGVLKEMEERGLEKMG